MRFSDCEFCQRKKEFEIVIFFRNEGLNFVIFVNYKILETWFFLTKGFVNMIFWKCDKQKGLTAVNMYKKFWDFVNGNFNINSAYLFDFFFIWVFSFTTTHNFWKIIHFVYCVLEFGYFPIFMCSAYFSKKAGKAQAKLIILRLRATLYQHIASHTGAKTHFYPEITKNLMFANCEFCEK